MSGNCERQGSVTPTFSSTLLSLDPIELLPLSLARSKVGDHSRTNNKTRGFGGFGLLNTFCILTFVSGGVINYLGLPGTNLSSLKTGPVWEKHGKGHTCQHYRPFKWTLNHIKLFLVKRFTFSVAPWFAPWGWDDPGSTAQSRLGHHMVCELAATHKGDETHHYVTCNTNYIYLSYCVYLSSSWKIILSFLKVLQSRFFLKVMIFSLPNLWCWS